MRKKSTTKNTQPAPYQTRAEVLQEWDDGVQPDFSVSEGRVDTWDVPTVNMRRRQHIPVINDIVTAEMDGVDLSDLVTPLVAKAS